jgi:hypothetical protein
MFSTPTMSTGVVKAWPSTVTCSPVGLVRNAMVEVRGTMSTKVSSVSGIGSVTRKWIRYHTSGDVSPSVGITKEPLVEPEVGGRKGWTCVS